MLVFDQHIMLGVHFADNIIVHCDNAALKASAELQIRFSVSEQEHISRITTDIYDKYTRRVNYHAARGTTAA